MLVVVIVAFSIEAIQTICAKRGAKRLLEQDEPDEAEVQTVILNLHRRGAGRSSHNELVRLIDQLQVKMYTPEQLAALGPIEQWPPRLKKWLGR